MLVEDTLDPIADARWHELVAASPTASVFHHPRWLELLHRQYRYPMLARCVLDERGHILAGLPFAYIRSRLTGRRLVALPFSDVCAPLIREPGDEPAIARLLASVRDEHQRTRLPVEIRSPLPGFGQDDDCFYQHELALAGDPEAVRAKFHGSIRTGISRAAREGIEVSAETDASALDAFYRLHLHTRRRLGVPTQPRRFIMGFAAGLFEHGLGFVLLARRQGQPVAAGVFLTFNGVLTYKYGASSFEHLKLRPNNAMFMEAIRWGCTHGQHTLDLGRTDSDNEGLREFKRRWGGREQTLAYSHLGTTERGSSGVPSIVRALISHTPPLTGRMAGAALYRHFG